MPPRLRRFNSWRCRIPKVSRNRRPSWCAGALKGFNDLEVTFLTEEIVDGSCYLRPGLVQLSPGDVVVDVGANVGVFSQQAATAVGKDGSVLSVEANPPTFRLLEENQAMLQQDGPLSTWHLVNAGVGSSDSGTLQMTFLPRAAGWGTCKGDQHMSLMKQDLKQFVRNMLEDKSSKISRSFLFKLGAFLQNVLPALFELVLELYVRWMASGAQQYNVPSRTLSSLFKEYDLGIVHLLKVDVEGAEISVLEGIDEHTWKNVQQVVVETHSNELRHAVECMLCEHYGDVAAEQSPEMRGTQLHIVYASKPLQA